MPSILHLRRRLVTEPQVKTLLGVTICTFAGQADIEPWLQLRADCFAKETPSPGAWTANDFQREFVARWWWRTERMWLAFATIDQQSPPGKLVGSVTLAERGAPQSSTPAIHWLMVHPAARRRGVASLLLAHAECACWNLGGREIVLETHSRWRAAVDFYRTRGYAE